MPAYWYPIQTKPRQEAKAEEHLARQGYTTYLPRIRLRKRRRNQWTEVTEPLFPNYLFIHADPDAQSLAPIRSTVGVARLVRFGQLLRPVPEQVIAFLKAAETAEGARDATATPYSPGDTVAVLQGPFTGLEAVYRMPSGADRALLLITLLGRDTEVAVPLDDIAPRS